MKFHKLGDLFQITSGGTPSRKNIEFFKNGSIPWVKTGDLKSKYVEEPLERISSIGLKNSSSKCFPDKTVLVAMYGATIGHCSILRFEASTNQACAAFLPNEKVNEEYLYYYLKSIYRELVLRGQGGGQPNISAGLLKEVSIPIPNDFDDQIRIATLLTRVESLVTTRNANLRLLDEFLKSTFLKMFGDPVRNERKWESDHLENIVAKDCPLTYGIVQPGVEYPNGVPIVRPVDLGADIIYGINLKRIDPIIDKKFKRTKLKGGEILVCVRGTTGVISAASEDLKGANVTRGITPIWFDNKINRLFAIHQLKSDSIQRKIQEKTYGATLKQINLKDVRALKLIQPPLEIQNEFAAIVKRFDNLKTLYQQSLDQVENLYSVLSQKAFKGELDLSRIPLTPITANGQISAPLPSIQGVAVVGKAMSYPVAREKLLRRLFARFVAEKKGTAFSLEEFWPFVEQEVLDHTDENSPPLGVAEYEQAKQWLFDLLKSSGVAQHFNEESNRLELSVRA